MRQVSYSLLYVCVQNTRFVVGFQVHPRSHITYAPLKNHIRVGKKLEAVMHVCFYVSISYELEQCEGEKGKKDVQLEFKFGRSRRSSVVDNLEDVAERSHFVMLEIM